MLSRRHVLATDKSPLTLDRILEFDCRLLLGVSGGGGDEALLLGDFVVSKLEDLEARTGTPAGAQ